MKILEIGSKIEIDCECSDLHEITLYNPCDGFAHPQAIGSIILSNSELQELYTFLGEVLIQADGD